MATTTPAPVRWCVPTEMNPPLNTTVIYDALDLDKLTEFFTRVNTFVYDVETNITKTFFPRRVRTIQIGDRNEQYVVDLLALVGGNTAVLEHCLTGYGQNIRIENPETWPLLKLREVLRPALESNKYLKVGANLQFDYEMTKWCLGLRMWHLWDIQLAEKLLYAGEVGFFVSGFWALDDLVERYLRLQISKDAQKTFDLQWPLTENQVVYTGLDARLPLPVMTAQRRRLEKEGLLQHAQIEFDAIPAFGDLHLNGMRLDREKWMAIYEHNVLRKATIIEYLDQVFSPLVGKKAMPPTAEEIDALEAEWKNQKDKNVRKKCREAFNDASKRRTAYKKRMEKGVDAFEGEAAINYGSPAQLRNAMLSMKGYTKTNLPDTNDKTLKKLSKLPSKFDPDDVFDADPELKTRTLIDVIRLYRMYDKRIDTYGPTWLLSIDPETGRVHSKIHQIGAETGRTSSSDPNIQNLPRSKKYRHAFVAAVGHMILTQDCGGQELRILTEYSLEKVWIHAFQNGYDVHSYCAEILLHTRWTEAAEQFCKYAEKKAKCSCKAHKKFREWLKSVNFGLAYGMTAGRLSLELGITYEEAQALLQAFHAAFPTVIKWLDSAGRSAVMNMESRTMSGFRRKYKKPTHDSARASLRKKLKREPNGSEVQKQFTGMFKAIEREGKNTPIQGTGAAWMKRAMGCGFDAEGKPYMWHRLEPEFGGKLVNFVHDENVTEVPYEDGPEVHPLYRGDRSKLSNNNVQEAYDFVEECMNRAGREFVKVIPVETEGHIADHWTK